MNFTIQDIVWVKEAAVINDKTNPHVINGNKSRMLVIMKVIDSTKEFIGFPITSKNSNSSHTKIPVGRITDNYGESFVETKPIKLPLNKILRKENQGRIKQEDFRKLQEYPLQTI